MRVAIAVTTVDESFRALGSDVRIRVTAHDARGLLARARTELGDFEACASRFRPDSELCALNADPRPIVPASRRLRDAVRAALWAADRSGGLCDPCLLDELEAAGYRRSFDLQYVDCQFASLSDADSQPARPDSAARWRDVRVDDERRTIVRPPRLRLDLGGSGKGHAADRVARLLASARSFVVDAGGDVRIGGEHEVHVAHPLEEAPAATLLIADGAVATSSIVRRAWRTADGRAAHHLLDPATGLPAWTGLLAVTALAPTTLEAETLSKAALLSGPAGARTLLAPRGGIAIHAGGEVERVGPLPFAGRGVGAGGEVEPSGAANARAAGAALVPHAVAEGSAA